MLLPRFLVSRRLGPVRPAARAPGAQRPAPTLRVARREGRVGDSGDVLRGTLRTLNVLKGTLKTSSHVPKAPLAR
jgi:hypothetical protein